MIYLVAHGAVTKQGEGVHMLAGGTCREVGGAPGAPIETLQSWWPAQEGPAEDKPKGYCTALLQSG